MIMLTRRTILYLKFKYRNDDYYEILFARYIEKLTFEKIANKTGWCWRQVHRIHSKALKEFEEKYGNEYL